MFSLVNSLNQGRHIERKRNIPQNYRVTRYIVFASVSAANSREGELPRDNNIPYRHFVPLRLRGGRAPFVAIATFPPFHRGNLPRRRKQKSTSY